MSDTQSALINSIILIGFFFYIICTITIIIIIIIIIIDANIISLKVLIKFYML